MRWNKTTQNLTLDGFFDGRGVGFFDGDYEGKNVDDEWRNLRECRKEVLQYLYITNTLTFVGRYDGA